MGEQMPLPHLTWLCDNVFAVAYDRQGTYIQSCSLPADHDGDCIPTWEHVEQIPIEQIRVALDGVL